MRRTWYGAAGLGLTVLLASCGGGSGAGGVPVVSTGPTPTPTPSATATPTPIAVYDNAFDLSRDRGVALIGAEVSATFTLAPGTGAISYTNIGGTLLDALIGPNLAYVTATQATSVAINNGAPTIAYDRTQLTTMGSDRLVYQPSDGFFAWYLPDLALGGGGGRQLTRYVTVVVQSRSVRNAAGGFDAVDRRFVGGSATTTADLPASGGATFAASLTSYSVTAGDSGTPTNTDAQLTVDFGAKTIGGTIVATSTAGPPLTVLTLTFNGTISTGSNRFNGAVTSTDGGTGRFTGQFHGPAGGELGFAFALQRPSGRVAGVVVGARR